MHQPTLFDTLEGRDTIQRRFEKFHAENPEVYRMLVNLARKVKAAGREKYGIKSLFEQIRWHYTFNPKPEGVEEFKLSNDYTSRYSRLIMEREPDLVGFFNLRPIDDDTY